MDSKKRLMFILEEDYYYITLKVLAVLKALECEKKPFEDYRKIAIIFELIKNPFYINFFEKIINCNQLDILDNEQVVGISCNAKMNTAVLKRVLFFLEKQNMINMVKSLKGESIDILLLKSEQLEILLSDGVLNEDIIQVKLIKKYIPRIRTIKIKTLRQKLFGTSEVTKWED
jgi:hypothetical protein